MAKHKYNSKKEKGSSPTTAESPFNFSAIHETLVTYDRNDGLNQSSSELFSGYIDLEIKTITPFFTRGAKEKNFRIGKNYAIPGSTLRGMLRNLCEQISFGKMVPKRHFQDRTFYFRAFADKHLPLRDLYNEEIVKTTNAGYLFFDTEKEEYYIRKAESFSKLNDRTKQFIYIPDENGVKVYSGRMDSKFNNWHIGLPLESEPIKVFPFVIQDYQDDKMRNTKVPDLLRIARKLYFEVYIDGNKKQIPLKHGAPIFFQLDDSNNVTSFGHTRFYRIPYISSVKDNIPLEIQKENVLDLTDSIFGGSIKMDGEEKLIGGKVFFEDLIKSTNESSNELSFLKILSSPKPTSFNLYKESSEDGKPLHWEEDGYIRGHKHYWHRLSESGDIYKANKIEVNKKDWDSFCKKTKFANDFSLKVRKDHHGNEKIEFQGNLSNLPNNLRIALLGFFNLSKEEENKLGVKSKPQNSLVEVLPSNTKFKGRIRFDSLAMEQLGLLLFALELPVGCAHKLGMGKPLGLGSIEIKSTLSTIEKTQKYVTLFDEKNNWDTGKSINSTKEQFKTAFCNYVLQFIGKSPIINPLDFWDCHLKLQDLRNLLTLRPVINNEKWLKETDYMSLDDFKTRPVLPYPDKVINRAK